MKFTCADCGSKACEFLDYEKMPSAEVCITRSGEANKTKNSYSEEDLRLAHNAAAVEAAGYGRYSRLEETMDFAKRMGYRKLGIAFCAGFSNEARVLAGIFRENGFEVEAAVCKNGSVPKEFIGIGKGQYVNREADFEIMCNPVGQAEHLCAQACELCVVLGLCVGHDSLFIRHCTVPVTVLVCKDRALGHNPAAAIYNCDSYLSRVHTFIKDHYES